MASPPLNSLLSLAILVVVASLSIYPSSAIPRSTITHICSLTKHPKRCENLLTSDPRIDKADGPQLSLISIELLSKQVFIGFMMFLALRDAAKPGDPAKAASSKCMENYRSLHIDTVLQARQYSESKQYEPIFPLMVKSLQLVRACGKEFKGSNSLAVRSVHKNMVVACGASMIVNGYVLQGMK